MVRYTKKEQMSAELSNLKEARRLYKKDTKALANIEHFEKTGYLTPSMKEGAEKMLRRRRNYLGARRLAYA